METESLLLSDKFAPITREVGFLETSVDNVVEAYTHWMTQAAQNRNAEIQLRTRDVSGNLDDLVHFLLPLTAPVSRHLFIPTTNSWAAYFNNWRRGTDSWSVISYLAHNLKCRGLRIVAIPDTYNRKTNKGRYGALTFEMYSPSSKHWSSLLRLISVINDGGRWTFNNIGEPFPFEDISNYNKNKIKDRFTLDMLVKCLSNLGFSPFDSRFYSVDGAVLVQQIQISPAVIVNEYTLEVERQDF